MHIEIKKQDAITVVAITGEIDGSTASEARLAASPLIQPGAVIALDLSGVSYMSSAGLRMLLLLHREVDARRGELLLVGLRREIRSIMSSTGFLGFFKVAEALGDAAPALVR